MGSSPWNSLGQNTGVGSHSLLQGIFPTQGSNPGLLHCRWILYQLSHRGSPRILEWEAYPFSRGSSQPRNPSRICCIAGEFLTNWAIGEALLPRLSQYRLLTVYFLELNKLNILYTHPFQMCSLWVESTLEQHGFELCWSTYAWISPHKYMLRYYKIPKLVESTDAQHCIWKADYQVIHGFSTVWGVGAPTPMSFMGQLYFLPLFDLSFCFPMTVSFRVPNVEKSDGLIIKFLVKIAFGITSKKFLHNQMSHFLLGCLQVLQF